MENNTEKTGGRGLRLGLTVLACVLAAAAAGYCALCAWVSGGAGILPNTFALGQALGGMSLSQAEEVLSAAAWAQRTGQTLEVMLRGGDGAEETALLLAGETALPADAAATAQAAWARGRESALFLRGWKWLSAHWAAPVTVDTVYSQRGQEELLALLAPLAEDYNRENATVEPTWALRRDEETDLPAALELTPGRDGLALTVDSAYAQIRAALEAEDFSPLVLTAEAVPAADLPLEDIYAQLYVAPADATVDPATYTVTPHVTGISFDIAQVRSALAAAGADDQALTVELTLTQPEVTTQALEATLFRDVLGSCTTKVGGSANRASNVRLAAQLCNGRVLFPGERFSYNEATGPRTEANGFLPAPSYVNGATVDSVGGGICQVSSTIYLAALRANMSIVARQNHSYAVDYVPDGMDATVYYGSIEFIFENNTSYPIKLVAQMEGRTLSVSILGTNEDGSYVKVTNRYLSTDPYETIYEESADLRPGESKEKVSGYTGKVVEVYRNVYDKEGNLLSSTLEHTDRYKRRDKVVLLAPEDMPGRTEPSGQETETTPGAGETSGQETETTPGAGETSGQEAETTPGAGETSGQEAETTPGTGETSGQETETTPGAETEAA